MSENKSTGIFINSFKDLLKSGFRLLFIVLAWLMKAAGMILAKTGETLEKIIIKKNAH